MERRRHPLAHTRALSHEPFHASTAHPSPPIPSITSTSATPPRTCARTHARTLTTRRILHAIFPTLQGKTSARAPRNRSFNQTRPQRYLLCTLYIGSSVCNELLPRPPRHVLCSLCILPMVCAKLLAKAPRNLSQLSYLTLFFCEV